MPTMLMSAAPLLQQQQQQQFKQQPLHQDLHQSQPTFNWTGVGRQQASRVYYDSFNFADELFLLGDCVYLLPEEEGAPPYIARLLKAWEDTAAPEPEKLVIEVQWFERRCAVPTALAAAMHEREVVESDLTDTNLVGCIDRKAVIVKAHSYAEALEQLPAAQVKGDWHFCRGILQSDAQVFRTYKELGLHQLAVDPASRLLPQDALNPFRFSSTEASHGQVNGNGSHLASGRDGVNGCHNSSRAFEGDDDMEEEPAPAPPKKSGGKGGSAASRSRRAAAAARVAAATAAAAAAGGGNVSRGVPGKVCCECGATQTPQWREGPMGPKTLCNACGVRYQRSQSKAKTNKRLASERAREQRGHSPVAANGSSRGQKAVRLSGGSSNALATATAAAVAAAAGADITAGFGADGPSHHHGTRSKASGTTRPPLQQQQQQRGRGRPPCGSKQHQQHLLVQQQQLQQAHGSSFGAEQHYYEDEGSPPNINTAILDVEEDEGAQRQPLKDALHRSATQDAADVLQQLSTAPRQQLQQLPQRSRQQPSVLRDQQHLHDLLLAGHPHQQSASSAFCSSIIGSPATLLLPDQLQHDSMSLLSLDDKLPSVVHRPGTPDGLMGISTNSLSPIQPRQPRMGPGPAGVGGGRGLLSSDGGGGSRPGMATTTPSATCASPGKLISSMLQGLKMPQPLNLNGPMPLPPLPSVTAALPAASTAMPVPGQQRQQQFVSVSHPTQQQWPPLVNSSSDVASKQQPGMGTPASANGSGNGSSNTSMPLLTQLQSLVYRASAFVPDAAGLVGLYPGSGNMMDMHHMVRQLEQSPLVAQQQLQQASAAVEETISRAKAADAAVLAVTQVLAAKKQAAADARAEVVKSMQVFRQTLGQCGPSVAAAIAGDGSSTCCDEPAVLPQVSSAAVGYLASGIGESAGLSGHAAVVSAAVPASSADRLAGSSRLGGNSPRVLVSQAPVLGGQDFGEVNCLGGASGYSLAAGTAIGPGGLTLGDASDADDLLRDPYAAEDAATTASAAAPAAVVPENATVMQQVLKTEQQQQQQEQRCVANDHVPDQQQLDQQKPKQQQVALKQDNQQQQHQAAKQAESMVQQQGEQQLISAMAMQLSPAAGGAAAGMPPQQQPPTPGSDLLANGSSSGIPPPPAAAAPSVATSAAPLVAVSAPPSAAHAVAETAPVAA